MISALQTSAGRVPLLKVEQLIRGQREQSFHLILTKKEKPVGATEGMVDMGGSD